MTREREREKLAPSSYNIAAAQTSNTSIRYSKSPVYTLSIRFWRRKKKINYYIFFLFHFFFFVIIHILHMEYYLSTTRGFAEFIIIITYVCRCDRFGDGFSSSPVRLTRDEPLLDITSNQYRFPFVCSYRLLSYLDFLY